MVSEAIASQGAVPLACGAQLLRQGEAMYQADTVALTSPHKEFVFPCRLTLSTSAACCSIASSLAECLPQAKRVIIAEYRAGQEITHTYNMDNERNDYALLNYLFIQRLDPPRLCSIDLPEGHLDASFPEMDDHYLPRDKAAILVRSFTSVSQLGAHAEADHHDQGLQTHA